jgi:putative cardiolipin synthase
MADEYFMRSEEANFIDMDVIAAGQIVRELSQVFDRYWNSDLAYPILPVMQALAPATAAAASDARFVELVRAAPPEFLPATTDPLGRAAVDYEFEAGRIAMEFAVAAVLADTPNKGALRNPGDTLSTVNRSVLEEFAAARSELLIASPYFIPGKVGLERLREVTERKVKVRVVTNGVGSTDEPLVHWRYARYRLNMLKMGIALYEVSPTLARETSAFGVFGLSFRRLHAKVAVFDQQRVFVGSMNFDPRSAWANTESGLLIESAALANQVHNLLDENNAGIYRLQLAADGKTIEWWSRGPDGNMRFTTVEPDNDWKLQLQRILVEPLVAEELL